MRGTVVLFVCSHGKLCADFDAMRHRDNLQVRDIDLDHGGTAAFKVFHDLIAPRSDLRLRVVEPFFVDPNADIREVFDTHKVLHMRGWRAIYTSIIEFGVEISLLCGGHNGIA